MATTDYILEVDTIKGESKPLKNGIDLLSFSGGATNSGSMATGGGGGQGKASVHDLSFTKEKDTASSALFLACLTGKHLKNAKLHCFKAGGDRKEYLTITLDDVLVSSYQFSGGGDAHPVDSFSLNFSKIHYEYKPQDEKGVLGATAEMKYNVKEAKAA